MNISHYIIGNNESYDALDEPSNTTNIGGFRRELWTID